MYSKRGIQVIACPRVGFRVSKPLRLLGDALEVRKLPRSVALVEAMAVVIEGLEVESDRHAEHLLASGDVSLQELERPDARAFADRDSVVLRKCLLMQLFEEFNEPLSIDVLLHCRLQELPGSGNLGVFVVGLAVHERDIDSHAIDAFLQPEVDCLLVNGISDFLVLPVQVRLLLHEQMQVVLVREVVVLPR